MNEELIEKVARAIALRYANPTAEAFKNMARAALSVAYPAIVESCAKHADAQRLHILQCYEAGDTRGMMLATSDGIADRIRNMAKASALDQ